jgi:NitT/TauT family transport system substrate-binding protein
MLSKGTILWTRPILELFGFFCIILCLFTLMSCSAKPEPILRVATNVWLGYEPLYLARSLGLYEKSSIRLVELTSASQVSQAIRNGTVEAAALTLDEVLSLLQAHDVELRVVLVMDISDGADVLLARSNIAKLTELRGKRVGVENTATGAILLDAALQSAGLQADEVKIIPLTANNHLAAWKNNVVDALVTFEPIRSLLLNLGAHELFNSKQIPGRILDVLVVRTDAIEGHEAVLKSLIGSYFTALEHLTGDPQDALIRMAPRLSVDVNQLMLQFKGLQFVDLADNRKWLSSPEPVLAKTAADLANLMREHQLLQGDINVSVLAMPEFLPEPFK